MKKAVIGTIEEVKIRTRSKVMEATALIDTGAAMNSIDEKLAREAGLGPPVRMFKVRAAMSKKREKRPVVNVTLEIKGRKFNTEANIKDRSHMRFPLLIGRNLLYNRFVVDVSRSKRIIRQ